MNPLVSIIMNCHNGERFLKEAIESVYSQTYSHWEIIFWDNASSDSSAKIAKSFNEKLRYFFVSKKTQLGEARNLAVREASGKYIAFLDCDDLYFPKKLEKQVQIMEKNNFVMSYGSGQTIDENGIEIKSIAIKNKSGYVFDSLLKHYEISMQSVMLLRSFLLENRLEFDINYKYCPDYNLFMLIACQNPVGLIQDFIVRDRVVRNSLQYSRVSINIAGQEVRNTLNAINERYPELRKKYSEEFKQAYSKSEYYDVVALIYSNDLKLARKKLQSFIFIRVEYLLLYLLLFLPLSNKLILNLLGR